MFKIYHIASIIYKEKRKQNRGILQFEKKTYYMKQALYSNTHARVKQNSHQK